MADLFGDLVDLVGAPIGHIPAPYVVTASADAIRLFARGYGDDNPIYSDPAYARSSVRGGLVAPPLFPIATGVAVDGAEDPGTAPVDLRSVPFASKQAIARERWQLLRPITEGVSLERHDVITGVELKHEPVTEGRADGVSYELVEQTRYTAGGKLYAVRERTRRYGPGDAQGTVSPAGPGARTAKATYSAAQIGAIESAYETELVRGSCPRRIEEVVVGERVGPLVKGPLTVTDLVEYRSGVGPGPLGAAPLRLAYANRKRNPQFYGFDADGVPDITERRHFDEKYAQALGLPSACDYSHTRLAWFSHVLTDWMGDGGWLLELDGTTALGRNFVGDTHRMEGTVDGVDAAGGSGEVRISLTGTNQWGDVTCKAHAVVLLPVGSHSNVTEEALEQRGAELGLDGPKVAR